MFASRTITGHLARGTIGLSALATAVALGPVHPVIALALVPIALVALRGCPTCWTIGLIQTLAVRLGARRRTGTCVDGRCQL